MSATLVLATPRVAGAWRRHLVALAAAAAVIVAIFHRDVARLVTIWWTSTTFGHCLFIGPVIGWLVWQRREELGRLTPRAWWPGLALVALGGLGWLMGEAGGVSFARQFGLVAMLQGAVVTLLGAQTARGLLFPLGYALFLVPFGEAIEPPLQQLTVAIVMPLLHLSGIPATSNGVLIHAGRYWFEVAEACSGAKFVIAMVAFGVLVANTCFLSWRRRAAFLAISVIVPILANGLRAFGTIYAADLTSVEAATGFDHIVYGWVFFGIVMAAVLALGWRWFDRAPDGPAFDPRTLSAPAGGAIGLPIATLLTVAVAGIWPMWAAATAHATVVAGTLARPHPPGWRDIGDVPAGAWRPYYPGANRRLSVRYVGAGAPVDLSIAVFAFQGEGHKLGAFGTGVLREEGRWLRVDDEAPIDGASVMRITAPDAGRHAVERLVATWYVVGDTVTADERRVKIETMKAKLFGGSQRAVAIHLSTPIVPGRDARADIAAMARALGSIRTLGDRAAGL
ncbi:exosortase A [Sphingomonas beigongshangi]|uniref:exosortase A n=1 Tax=Sphingomonas beigongshangi TaxID=2782540 RepID=UPI0030B7F706